MIEAFRINSAKELCIDILHVLVSSIGILNRECAVLPPSNSYAAIPDDATAKAILPIDRIFAKIVL